MKTPLLIAAIACMTLAQTAMAQYPSKKYMRTAATDDVHAVEERLAALESRLAVLNRHLSGIEHGIDRAARAPVQDKVLRMPTVPEARRLTASEELVERGIYQYHIGDLLAAYRSFTRAIEADPRNPRGYQNRGVLRLWAHDLDNAIADLTAAIRLNPTYAVAYANRGLAHERKGNFVGATADYRIAERLGMDTGSASCKVGLGVNGAVRTRRSQW